MITDGLKSKTELDSIELAGKKIRPRFETEEALKSNPKIFNLFIIGCGGVGGALIEQIREQQVRLLDNELEFRIQGIANKKSFHSLIDEGELASWKEIIKMPNDGYSLTRLNHIVNHHQLANSIIIDCTGSSEIALEYPKWIKSGFHVVAANKVANALSMDKYNELRRLTRLHGRQYRYEANIGAGLPIIEPLQKLLMAGDRLNKLEGIFSGSLSFIFGEMNKGTSLSDATLKARELGFTEPDPRADLSGLDVARKILIIAREAGFSLELSDIEVESVIPREFTGFDSIDEFFTGLKTLDPLFERRVSNAKKEGRALRYVARMNKEKFFVGIVEVDELNPLYGVVDGENVLALYSNYYSPKPLVVKGYGAGNEVTAAGVFSDILRIAD